MREEGTVWVLPLGKRSRADVLIVGRLKPPERSIMDYFVLPALSQLHGGLRSRAMESVDYLELYHLHTSTFHRDISAVFDSGGSMNKQNRRRFGVLRFRCETRWRYLNVQRQLRNSCAT